MKSLLRIVAVLAILLVVLAAWIALPLLSPPERVELGASAERVALLQSAPDVPELYVLTSSGPLLRRLESNPITSRAIQEQKIRNGQLWLLPWLLGRSDVVAWRGGDDVAFLARPDGIRRAILRLYTTIARPEGVSFAGDDLLVSNQAIVATMPRAEIEQFLSMSRGRKGEAFILVRAASHVSFPPVGKPSVTNIAIDDESVRADAFGGSIEAEDPASRVAPPPQIPANPMLTLYLASASDTLGRFEQLFPIKLSDLFQNGGTIAVYSIDSGMLLPRIKGAVILPANDAQAAQYVAKIESANNFLSFAGLGSVEQSQRTVAGVPIVRRRGPAATIEYARRGEQFVIGFDTSSVEKYLTSEMLQPKTHDAVEWLLACRPNDALPALDDLRKQRATKLLAPSVSKGAGRLESWLKYLDGAAVVTIWRERPAGNQQHVTVVADAAK